MRTYLKSLGTRKLKVYSLLVGFLWFLLILLAENPEVRTVLERFKDQLVQGVQGAQVAEHFFKGLDQASRASHAPFLHRPFMALWYAGRQVWASGWFSVLIGIISLCLAFSVYKILNEVLFPLIKPYMQFSRIRHSTLAPSVPTPASLDYSARAAPHLRPWVDAVWLMGVTLGAAVIAWLLKLLLILVLSAFGMVIQLVGFFSVGILIVEKLRVILEFWAYAEKVDGPTKTLPTTTVLDSQDTHPMVQVSDESAQPL